MYIDQVAPFHTVIQIASMYVSCPYERHRLWSHQLNVIQWYFTCMPSSLALYAFHKFLLHFLVLLPSVFLILYGDVHGVVLGHIAIVTWPSKYCPLQEAILAVDSFFNWLLYDNWGMYITHIAGKPSNRCHPRRLSCDCYRGVWEEQLKVCLPGCWFKLELMTPDSFPYQVMSLTYWMLRRK